MRLTVEEAAYEILETVQQRLPHAAVDYESFGGTHYFYIDQAGVQYLLRFPEHALQRRERAELQSTIQEIVNQVNNAGRRASATKVGSARMPTFPKGNAAAVRHMASEPTLPIGRD